jgi:hypothetical protein
MTTTQSYERKYGPIIAAVVLSSKAKVAAAGRWWDQARVEAERTSPPIQTRIFIE